MKKTFNLVSKIIINMSRSGIYSFLFFLLLPQIFFGQIPDSETFKQKANELLRKGAFLNSQGRYSEALDTFKLFLDYQIKVYGTEDYALGRAYLALGIANKNLGHLDRSLQNYQLAEKNYRLRQNLNPVTLADLYINIGNVYRSKLDFTNALRFFEQALTIYIDENSEFDIYDTYYSIAEIKHLMTLEEEALEILNTNYNKTDTVTRIRYSELLAIVYQTVNQYSKAEQYYQIAIKLNKEYYGETDMGLATEFMNYGFFLTDIQQFEKATLNFDKAYNIITIYQTSKGSSLSKYFEYKGDLFRKINISTPDLIKFRQQRKANLDEAIKWYDKSLDAIYTGNGEARIENLTINNCLSFTDCMTLLKTTADTYLELAALDKEVNPKVLSVSLTDALDYYKVIGQLLQRARQEISSDESKIQLAQLEHQTFTKTIQAANMAYELSHSDEYLELAFASSEQIKSSAVFDQISTNLAQENSLIPDSLIELESKLNNTITYYNEKLYEEQDTTILKDYNERIFDANRQRDELYRFLEENYPDYYDLKYSRSMMGVKDIQSKLSRKDAIIEYVINETDSTQELFTFLITTDNKKLLRQVITPEMASSMQYMFNFMTTPNYIFTRNEDSQEFCVAANNMYNLLIEPVNNEIKNKNIIIVPDGKLNYIAFDGLLKTMPDTSQYIDFSKLDYLVRDCNVNYANSANILLKYKKDKRSMRNRILAFAPEYESEKVKLSNAEYTLLPLPGVQKEVDEISKMTKTSIYRGKDASEENFRKLSSGYNILHLAMHAYINDSLPAFSRLAFSPKPGEKDILKDGWLNTADIYNLNLRNVRLSVLSACNTGTGKMQRGEGLMSLARGFLYAGCPSIVVSLWEVEDNAGTQIMTSFYKNLERGKTKDAALRAAKLEYLENSNSRLAHPHYWMSFKSIGDNSPVYNSNDVYFFALLIALSLFFAIDQGIRIRKARRKRQAS